MCRLLPYCAAAARETGPRRPVSTPSIRCSELRLERLTPGKKLRRKGSPRSEGTSRHSYVNYCRPYRTGGLQMSSTRCFRVSGPENGRRCRGAPARGARPDVINAAGRLENGAEVSVQIASVPSGGPRRRSIAPRHTSTDEGDRRRTAYRDVSVSHADTGSGRLDPNSCYWTFCSACSQQQCGVPKAPKSHSIPNSPGTK